MNLIPFPIPLIILALCFALLCLRHQWIGKEVLVFEFQRHGVVIDVKPSMTYGSVLTVRLFNGMIIDVNPGQVEVDP